MDETLPLPDVSKGPVMDDFVQVTVVTRGGGVLTLLTHAKDADKFRAAIFDEHYTEWSVRLIGVRPTPLVLNTQLWVRRDQVVMIDIQEAPGIVYNAARTKSLEQLAATGVM